ncbi:MAG: hypothetical protein AAF560_09465 [Acidobacteriota bacterium]
MWNLGASQLLNRGCLFLISGASLCLVAGPLMAQAPCNEADTVGGGTLGVSPGMIGPPDSLGWDVGSGQCNGSFVSASDAGFPGGSLELGLRAEQRSVGQVPRMAGGDYEVQLGNDTTAGVSNRAWWNFHLSIAYGGSLSDLDALTLQIRTDVGSNLPASPTVDLLAGGLRGLIDARNNQPNATSGFSDLYQVSQNPEFTWFTTASDTDANPTGDFNYDEEGAWRMRLSATEAGTELAAEMCIHTPSAACVYPRIGAAKQMTPLDSSLPATIEIVYTFENFGGDTLLALSAIDDLAAVFGTEGVDWTATSITSAPPSFANPSFTTPGTTELINQGPVQSLGGGSLATVTVNLELLTIAAADMSGDFCNQITVTGSDSLGVAYSDLSASGLDPDANGDTDPVESGVSCFNQTAVPVSLQSFTVD